MQTSNPSSSIVQRPLDRIADPFIQVARSTEHLNIGQGMQTALGQSDLVIELQAALFLAVGANPACSRTESYQIDSADVAIAPLKARAPVDLSGVFVCLYSIEQSQPRRSTFRILCASARIVFPALSGIGRIPAGGSFFCTFLVCRIPTFVSGSDTVQVIAAGLAVIRVLPLAVGLIPHHRPVGLGSAPVWVRALSGIISHPLQSHAFYAP